MSEIPQAAIEAAAWEIQSHGGLSSRIKAAAALQAVLPTLREAWAQELLERIDHVELALSGIGHIEALFATQQPVQPTKGEQSIDG